MAKYLTHNEIKEKYPEGRDVKTPTGEIRRLNPYECYLDQFVDEKNYTEIPEKAEEPKAKKAQGGRTKNPPKEAVEKTIEDAKKEDNNTASQSDR